MKNLFEKYLIERKSKFFIQIKLILQFLKSKNDWASFEEITEFAKKLKQYKDKLIYFNKWFGIN